MTLTAPPPSSTPHMRLTTEEPRSRFVRLPFGLMDLWPHLTPPEKNVLVAMMSFGEDMYPSMSELAKRAGVTRNNANLAVLSLRAAGVLVVTFEARRRPTHYALADVDRQDVVSLIIAATKARTNTPTVTENSDITENDDVTKNDASYHRNQCSAVTENSAPSSQINKPNELAKERLFAQAPKPDPTPKAKPAKTAPSPTSRFAEFWDAWPRHHRKAGKDKCAAKWRSLGLEGGADVVLAKLDSWKGSRDWAKDGGAYIPAPLVWLNGRRWEAPAPPPAVPEDDVEEPSEGVLATLREFAARNADREAVAS